LGRCDGGQATKVKPSGETGDGAVQALFLGEKERTGKEETEEQEVGQKGGEVMVKGNEGRATQVDEEVDGQDGVHPGAVSVCGALDSGKWSVSWLLSTLNPISLSKG
jgi:hypothetical protein